MEEEIIVWEGKPKYKARWAFLEIFFSGNNILLMFAYPVLLFLSALGFIQYYGEQNYTMLTLIIFINLLILFGIEIHKSIRRKNTHYVVTEDKIKISDYWYGQKLKQEVPFSNIAKFYLEDYKDGIGIIHIFIKDDSERHFKTRGFFSGMERHHLTFEDIENAATLYELLRIQLKQINLKENK